MAVCDTVHGNRWFSCSSIGRVPGAVIWSTSYCHCSAVEFELKFRRFGSRKIATAAAARGASRVIQARARRVAIIRRDSDGERKRCRLVGNALKNVVRLLSHELCSSAEGV